MASFVYDSLPEAVCRGNVDFDTDTFKVILVEAGYIANKGTHAHRSDVTHEVTGAGYTAGGAAIRCTVARSATGGRTSIGFDAVDWTASTITARGAVIYKAATGGAAATDPLVCYVDFGSNIVSTASTFTLGLSEILVVSN